MTGCKGRSDGEGWKFGYALENVEEGRVEKTIQ